MINNSIIYSNRIIEPRFYFVKLVNLETEDCDFAFPKIMAQLRFNPKDGVPKDTILTSIIHPSHKSAEIYNKFIATFLIDDINDPEQIKQAIGRWGSVGVFKAKYDKTEYSAIAYKFQSQMDVRVVLRITRQEEDDCTFWDEV